MSDVVGLKRDAPEPPARTEKPAQRLRPTAFPCPWCGQEVVVNARGRVPKWCSDACRHRAWEQGRAAKSGRSSVEIVERIVEVERVKEVPIRALTRDVDWPFVLETLAQRLDTGRVYDRDLHPIVVAVSALNHAVERRVNTRNRRSGRW